MESYTITKKQLIEFAENQVDDNTLVIKEIMPTKDVAIRVNKDDINDYLEKGDEHKGWVELVPINKNNKKIFRLTTEQFGKLLIYLKINFSEENDIIRADELDID